MIYTDFTQNGLSAIVNKYSVADAVELAHPGLKPWELARNVGNNFWTEETAREFMLWAGKRLGKEPSEITVHNLGNLRASGVVRKFGIKKLRELALSPTTTIPQPI